MPGVDLSWIFVRESQLSDTFGSSWENELRLAVTHVYQNERVEILTEKKNRLPHVYIPRPHFGLKTLCVSLSHTHTHTPSTYDFWMVRM